MKRKKKVKRRNPIAHALESKRAVGFVDRKKDKSKKACRGFIKVEE